MDDLSNTSLILAALGTFIVGVSKAGVKGIGVLAVTILAVVFGSKASVGIVLIFLVAGDIMAVIYYRKYALWNYLVRLIPFMILGVILAAVVGKDMPDDSFKRLMGIIIVLCVIGMFYWENRKTTYIPYNWWFSGIMGGLAGFTTMIGNLAGPIANIYFLAMRIPKNQFIGTTAWLFFVINLVKMPFHIFTWGTINESSLWINLKLMPIMVVGFFVGVKIIQIIREKTFRYVILILTALGAVIIFFK